MAERRDEEPRRPATEPVFRPAAEPNLTEAERVSRAMVEAERQAEERQADETVPGGKYKVGDEWVDADGKPFKGKGE
jgi:hypothetical protein